MSTDHHIDLNIDMDRVRDMGIDIAIDWTSCQGHGLCAELLPEHITLDEWGYPLVNGTPVPSRTVKRARRAAADCPVLALTTTEPKGRGRKNDPPLKRP